MLNFMFVDCIRNGEHRTIEEQADQPALPGPVDAPEDASKENVSPTKAYDEVEETMGM
jgi:coiled-coil domain-containing protein 12